MNKNKRSNKEIIAEKQAEKEKLEKEGINIRVVDIHTIKPIDRELIMKCAKETKKIKIEGLGG